MSEYGDLLKRVRAARPQPPGGSESPGGGNAPSGIGALLGKIKEFKEAPVVEEMHPVVTQADRFLIQNFSNAPDVGLSYLQKKYPGLEGKMDESGKRILIRTPGEKAFRVVDPNTGFLSSDILNDASDVAYDAVATGVQTAASVPGLIVGSVPGAIAAGGVSGAGLEALRQKLGQTLGLPQEINNQDVVASGALGAALPGAGAALGGAAKLAAKTAPTWVPAVGKAAGGAVGSSIPGVNALGGTIVGAELGGKAAEKLVAPGVRAALAPVGHAISTGVKNLSPATRGAQLGAWKALYQSKSKKEAPK